jgi:hypothetical protein
MKAAAAKLLGVSAVSPPLIDSKIIFHLKKSQKDNDVKVIS